MNTTSNATGCGRVSDDGEVDEVPGGLVAMGTILVIVASFISCFGVNLQKWAHNVEAQTDPADRKGMLRSWRWWLGIVCMVVGSLMDMAALPFVPMSRVAALGSSTIVANIIITPLFLKEKLTKHDYVGCAITVSGTALACYFGAGGEAEISSQCLLHYFIEPLFLVYISCVVLALLVLLYFVEGYRRFNKMCKEAKIVGGEDQPQVLETVWVHDNVAKLAEVPRDKHFVFITSLGPQFYPSVHAIFAGGCGAQSVMFAKAVLIFLGNAIGGEDTGMSVLYLLVCLLPCVFCIWLQLKYLNEALRIYCDAIFVLPVYQAVWICGGVASGLVFYQEYMVITGVNIVLFALGLVMCLAGLAVLAKRKNKTAQLRRVQTEMSMVLKVRRASRVVPINASSPAKAEEVLSEGSSSSASEDALNDEYRIIKGLNIAVFALGIFLALLGLAVLAGRKSRAGGAEIRYKLGENADNDNSKAPAEPSLHAVITAVENIPAPLPVFIPPIGVPVVEDLHSERTGDRTASHTVASAQHDGPVKENPLQNVVMDETTCSVSEDEAAVERASELPRLSPPPSTVRQTFGSPNGSAMHARTPSGPIAPPPSSVRSRLPSKQYTTPQRSESASSPLDRTTTNLSQLSAQAPCPPTQHPSAPSTPLQALSFGADSQPEHPDV